MSQQGGDDDYRPEFFVDVQSTDGLQIEVNGVLVTVRHMEGTHLIRGSVVGRSAAGQLWILDFHEAEDGPWVAHEAHPLNIGRDGTS